MDHDHCILKKNGGLRKWEAVSLRFTQGYKKKDWSCLKMNEEVTRDPTCPELNDIWWSPRFCRERTHAGCLNCTMKVIVSNIYINLVIWISPRTLRRDLSLLVHYVPRPCFLIKWIWISCRHGFGPPTMTMGNPETIFSTQLLVTCLKQSLPFTTLECGPHYTPH